jgi:heme/copper-type cytochrome/quinol oxidase subunit 4
MHVEFLPSDIAILLVALPSHIHFLQRYCEASNTMASTSEMSQITNQTTDVEKQGASIDSQEGSNNQSQENPSQEENQKLIRMRQHKSAWGRCWHVVLAIMTIVAFIVAATRNFLKDKIALFALLFWCASGCQTLFFLKSRINMRPGFDAYLDIVFVTFTACMFYCVMEAEEMYELLH